MKKRKRLVLKIFTIALLFFAGSGNVLFAGGKTVKIGINFSSFRNSDARAVVNYAFALSAVKKLKGNFYFLPELLLIGQGSLLKNKPVKNEDWQWHLSAFDIKVLQYYLEAPLLIGYPVMVKNQVLIIYLGPSFQVSITDGTTMRNEKIIYDDDQPGKKDDFINYDFEFVQGDYEGHFLGTSGISLNVGIQVSINTKFSFELRYSYSLNKVGAVGQLRPLNRKLHAVILFLGVQF